MIDADERLYAHTLPNRPCSEWELLSDHREKVAAAASDFAAVFGAGPWGAILGRCHDQGKSSAEFQRYLVDSSGLEAANAGEERDTPKRVDHSTYGARYVAKSIDDIRGQLLAFCIAGHHAGLPNEACTDDSSQRSTLRYRLDEKSIPPADASNLTSPALRLPLKAASSDLRGFQLAFFTRMIFSCLVDADRTCTEAFCNRDQAEQRQLSRPGIHDLRAQLDAYLELMTASERTQVNLCRDAVLQQCLRAAELDPGFFSLQVPTGGGKTLSSLAFALHHASHGNLRRVVVAIPFTSIIEQTTDVYRRALGRLADQGLVEHHTNLRPIHDTRANQFGAENWDAPLIVTTNVQLLESLFAAATTPCRKLHRLANSVIILDEAQMLPVDLLEATLAVLRELVRNYGCTIVLCTATQPALEFRGDFPIGLEDVRPIIAEPKALFKAMRRVEVRHVGRLDDRDLAMRLSTEPQVLCIVNTRRHAARLYDGVASQSEPGTCFHLSTLMCGAHRRQVIETIRERIRGGNCRIISTQLIEAGVDIDLPVVYRAAAGFDSIAQAAGRCNREGRAPMGTTYVFDGENPPPPGLLRDGEATAKELLKHFPDVDPLSPYAVEAYFSLLYWKKRESWDKKRLMPMMQLDHNRPHRAPFQFRDIADSYRLIEDKQLPILVPFDRKSEEFGDDLLSGRVNFVPDRQLQPYLVSIPARTVRDIEKSGFVQAHDSGVWVLCRKDGYTHAKGLTLESIGMDPSLWGV
jgi:CRISPR-associated endonuclease/helicase Cas3